MVCVLRGPWLVVVPGSLAALFAGDCRDDVLVEIAVVVTAGLLFVPAVLALVNGCKITTVLSQYLLDSHFHVSLVCCCLVSRTPRSLVCLLYDPQLYPTSKITLLGCVMAAHCRMHASTVLSTRIMVSSGLAIFNLQSIDYPFLFVLDGVVFFNRPRMVPSA